MNKNLRMCFLFRLIGGVSLFLTSSLVPLPPSKSQSSSLHLPSCQKMWMMDGWLKVMFGSISPEVGVLSLSDYAASALSLQHTDTRARENTYTRVCCVFSRRTAICVILSFFSEIHE